VCSNGSRCLADTHPTGKPNENAYIESFNGKFREESLNEHWFINPAHAKQYAMA